MFGLSLGVFHTVVLFVCFFAVNSPVKAQAFLPPERAFAFNLSAVDPACQVDCLINVRVKVAPTYYLYRERFALQNPMNLPLLEFVNLPQGERKFDEFLKQNVEVLRGDLDFQIRYSLGEQSPAGASAILLSQGCAEAGLCYPPMPTPIAFVQTPAWGNVLEEAADFFKKSDALKPNVTSSDVSTPVFARPLDEAETLASHLVEQSAIVVLPIFFGLGLLLAFTPCTLPMLPIVSSLLVGSAAGRSRPAILALVYVLGMALTYALLGMLAGLSGQSLVVALQQAPILWAFGALLAVLGGALLLGFSLQLPSVFQSWLQEKTGRLKGGTFLPVLVMGVLSALLLGPCVAPPLAGALLYIGQSGNALLGASALFLLALGMGLPLVLVAAGVGTVLPRAGVWMTWISGFFGFALLALAIWAITPVTPIWLIMGAWLMWNCLVSLSLFHGSNNTPTMSTPAKVLSKAAGLLFALLALVYALGLFSGAKSLLQPLAQLRGSTADSVLSQHASLPFERVLSKDLAFLLENSQEPVMLDFYAAWCVSCKEFELLTLTDEEVKRQLRGIRLLQVDMTDNTKEDQLLLKRFDLFGPPAILFFKPLSSVPVHRVIGFQNANRFSETLNQVRGRMGLF